MSYRTMPLGRQILLPAMLLLVLVFTIMIALTAWLTGQAAMAQAQLELGNEVRLVVGGLDSEFDSAKARGARQLHFFEQFLGGAVQPGEGGVSAQIGLDARIQIDEQIPANPAVQVVGIAR